MKKSRLFLCFAALLPFSASAQEDHAMPMSAEPDITLALFPERAPSVGKPIRVIAQLMLNGKPLTEDNLKTVHTQKFHLLAIDPTLTDYQHIHPTATATPGSYLFTFTPKLEGGYRAWADVTPFDTGAQQFAIAGLPPLPSRDDMDGILKKIDRHESMAADAGGYHFTLSFNLPPMPYQPSTGTIIVSDKNGQPVRTLAPVMGAYAHIVGFYDDFETALHTHPTDQEAASKGLPGGPTLSFTLTPPKSGFMRLFAQVKIGGEDIFVPFGINVIASEAKQSSIRLR